MRNAEPIPGVRTFPKTRLDFSSARPGHRKDQTDAVAVEEPLEIRVEGRPVAVVMRTPGHDRELVAGFLVTEGVLRSPDDVFEISPCGETQPEATGNVMEVLLRNPDRAALDQLTRHVFSASSCGICGKATIESIFANFPPVPPGETCRWETLRDLPGRLREVQANFDQTGGLHASGLFSLEGEFQLLREDVGRHNALDKVIGHQFLEGSLPLHRSILLVSGRISFELTQKALAAGIPVVAGISAPSSLAIELARDSGITLAGCRRPPGCDLYTHPGRVT